MKLFKKIIILTGFIIAFLLTNSYAETATVKIQAARIRAEKNTTSTVITVVYEDDEVELIEKGNEWSKIKYGEFSGYVKTEFLNISNSESNTENTVKNENNSLQNNNQSQNTETKENTQNTITLEEDEILISSNTYIKLLPNFMSKNVQEIQKGQKYKITVELNNWVKITDGTIEGWILKNKTTKENVVIENNNTENNEKENTVNDATSNIDNTVANDVTTSENITNTSLNRDGGSADYKKTGIVNVETAKIREKATTESKNTGFLDYGDSVTILGEENDFYKITFEDKSGYVSKKLITIEEKKTSSRSLTEERKELQSEVKEKASSVVEESSNIEQQTQTTTETNSIENNSVTEFAIKFLNYPYVLGGKTPETGFDCSGFTRYIFKNFGYNLASTAAGQTTVGDEINKKEDLMPGDLILFQNEEKTKIGHTGIYLGNNEFIHAANPERGVVIDNISTNSYYNERFVSARRIVK